MLRRVQAEGFAPVRDGILEHHSEMSFAEIAVFHHLLNCAVRSERKAETLGCKVGFCPDMTGNRLAAAMGKSRDSVQRALRALACHGKAKRRFITRTPDGIMVHNFDGTGAVEIPDEPAVKQASPDHGRPEYRPVPAVKQAGAGRNIGQDNRRDVGDVGDVFGANAPQPHPVHWDSAIRNVVIDKGWLRGELEEYQREAGVVLTEPEYEHEAEQLRLELLRDARLRACIRKANGKPSTDSKFKALATYTSGWFKRALRFKAGRAGQSRASPNSAPARRQRTSDAMKQVMQETLEEEQREQQAGDRENPGEIQERIPSTA